MPNKRVDQLLDAAPDGDLFAASIEAHLDVHPFPVDELQLEAVVGRLEAKMRRARPWRWLAGFGLAVAAVAMLAAGASVRHGTVRGTPTPPPIELLLEHPDPAQLHVTSFEGLEREVEGPPTTRVVQVVSNGIAVVLVSEGELVADDGAKASAGEWMLLTRLEDGSPQSLVFSDGERPPPLHPDAWSTAAVQRQLRAARWKALPTRTLEALDTLLETR